MKAVELEGTFDHVSSTDFVRGNARLKLPRDASQPNMAEQLITAMGMLAFARFHIVLHCWARRGAGAWSRLGTNKNDVAACSPRKKSIHVA